MLDKGKALGFAVITGKVERVWNKAIFPLRDFCPFRRFRTFIFTRLL